MGCGIVVTIVGVCVGATHGGVAMLACEPQAWSWLLPLVYAEALAALVCLAGLVFDDPGVVARSRDRCAPLPPLVVSKLRGAKVTLSENIPSDREGGGTFCVRCYVWRPPAPPAYDGKKFHSRTEVHHCSTCQRCVVDFDHHCGVFGRCIAGKGLKGNFKYFSTIIVLGYAGAATATAALMLGVLKCSRGNWWGSWTNIVLLTFAGYVAVAAAGWFVVATCQCAGAILDFLCDRCPAPRGRGDPMR